MPIRKELRQWKDRKKIVEMPLIPSYIFTHIEEIDMWNIVKLSGCVKFIWFNNKPCSIPDYQIDSMKILLQKEIEIEIENSIKPLKGDRVKIVEGPFAGLVGLVKNDSKHNFAVRIDTLGVDLSIILEESNLEVVEKIEE